jgi:hypothetical protein
VEEADLYWKSLWGKEEGKKQEKGGMDNLRRKRQNYEYKLAADKNYGNHFIIVKNSTGSLLEAIK